MNTGRGFMKSKKTTNWIEPIPTKTTKSRFHPDDSPSATRADKNIIEKALCSFALFSGKTTQVLQLRFALAL